MSRFRPTRRRAAALAAVAVTGPLLVATTVSAGVPSTASWRPWWYRPSATRPSHPATPTTTPATTTPTTAPENCRVIDFETARVMRGDASSPGYRLEVSGFTPYFHMPVRLSGLVYVRQPDYWGYQVQACMLGDVGMPALSPFTVSLDLGAGRGSGSLGVEAIGATKSVRLDLPPAA